jgi:hypothetical protein
MIFVPNRTPACRHAHKRGGRQYAGGAGGRLLGSWLLGISLLLAGCGTKQVVVEGVFPTPLVSKYPLTLGVWYDQAFREHEFFDEAKGRSESDWLVRTGEAQVLMWDQLLGGLFQRVVHLDAPPGEGEAPAVDAILVPGVDELQYAIPTQTNIKVYEIWMRYNLALHQPDGRPIAEWQMTAYGKTPTAFLQTDEAAVNLAAVMALRDAGAHFTTTFGAIPDVALWLEDAMPQPTQTAQGSAPVAAPAAASEAGMAAPSSGAGREQTTAAVASGATGALP